LKALLHLNKSEGGELAWLTPVELGAVPVRAALGELAQHGHLPFEVDEVIFGCATQTNGQGLNLGRQVALQAGLSDDVACSTVSRLCSSSLYAIRIAAMQIMSGQTSVAIAGGVEHMSRVGLGADRGPMSDAVTKRVGHPLPIIAAERMVSNRLMTREMLDRYAATSYTRYGTHRTQYGAFTAPVFQNVRGREVRLDADAGVRLFPTFTDALETFSRLKPRLAGLEQTVGIEHATLTAPHASREVDGAAAVVLMSEEVAKRHGYKPLGRFVAGCAVGSDLKRYLTGIPPSVRKCFGLTGLAVKDIDLWEVNDAFGPVGLDAIQMLDLDPQRVNIWGSALVHGHPLGATGAMLTAKLLHQLRVHNERFGVVTMCTAFGGGETIIVENLEHN